MLYFTYNEADQLVNSTEEKRFKGNEFSYNFKND